MAQLVKVFQFVISLHLLYVTNLVTMILVIRNFRHKGVEDFFDSGTTKGINPNHAKRLSVRLDAMVLATSLQDLNQPGWQLHELKGNRKGEWSIHVNGPWCLTFKWDEETQECIDVDYEQYH